MAYLDIGALQSGSGLDIGALQSGASSGPQTITLGSAIPSGEYWGTPSVGGGSQTLTGAHIPTGEFWGRAVVAGPVSLVAPIPSGEHWGTPELNLNQSISPAAGIPSGERWALPGVFNSLNIFLAGPIPSGENWPTPAIRGPLQYVNAVGIPTGESWAFPTIVGPVQDIRVLLAGIDVTAYFKIPDNCNIASQTLGRWTAAFDLYDDSGFVLDTFFTASTSPATTANMVGQSVIIFDVGRRVFAGCLTQCIIDRAMSTESAIFFHITATDKSGICDHRVVTGSGYPAGSDVITSILDVVTNYLAGEGIGTTQLPAVGTYGTFDTDQIPNFGTVTNTFDSFCQDAGLVWWIDANCNLHFSPLNNLPSAPFSLSETSLNWRALTTTITTQDYYNKMYAVSNLSILPGSGSGGTGGSGDGTVTETFTWAIGSPGIVSGIVGGVLVPFTLQVSQGIQSVASMTVAGINQTVVAFQNYSGQTSMDPTTDFLWFFSVGSPGLAPTYGPIPTNAVISVQYVPGSSNASGAQYGSAISPSTPSGDPLQGCGSGIFEGVIQVYNLSEVDQLNAVAAAELARIGNIPTVIDFETDQGGLAPGQLLSIDVPQSGAVGDYLVTQVNGTYQGSQLEYNSAFKWKIECTSNLDPGNWYAWYERLVGRTANPLPIYQYEEATFVLGSGSNVSTGVAVTNPYIVGRTGLLVQLMASCSTPPENQNLVMTVTVNNENIATITIPATASANQLFTLDVPVASQLYLFAQQVLNCNASYLGVGGTPAPAAGVTFKVRWRI